MENRGKECFKNRSSGEVRDTGRNGKQKELRGGSSERKVIFLTSAGSGECVDSDFFTVLWGYFYFFICSIISIFHFKSGLYTLLVYLIYINFNCI